MSESEAVLARGAGSADCCRRRLVTPQPSKLSSTMILASHLVVLPLAFVVATQQVVDCQAVLTLSRALSSSMVLQRSPARARLWGTDAPGAVVTVAQAAASTTVDTTGRWSLLLPPHSAGPAFGTGTIVVSSSSSSAENNVTLDDVLYGETWLCTGE